MKKKKPITSTSHSSFKEVEMVVMLILAFIIRISIKKVSSVFSYEFLERAQKPDTSRTEKIQHRPDFL